MLGSYDVGMRFLEGVMYRGPYRAPSVIDFDFLTKAKSTWAIVGCLVGAYFVCAVVIGQVAASGRQSFDARYAALGKAVDVDVDVAAEPITTVNTVTEPDHPPASGSAGSTSGLYSYGQCTYYVASRRFVPGGWGDAANWMSSAKAAGYQTGTEPKPGAIAWTPGGSAGHVAYVEQVNGSQVLISEMNFEGWNQVTQRWVSAGDFEYIY